MATKHLLLNISLTAALVSMTGVSVAATSASSWDATQDFSTTTNPGANGVWSYGTMSTLYTGAFSSYTVFTPATSNGGLAEWANAASTVPPGFSVPGFGKADSAGAACCNTVNVPPNTLWAHPGSDGTYSVLRFVAPTAGTYQVNAAFWSDDNRSTYPAAVADVNVGSTNGLYTNFISAAQQSTSFAGSTTLAQGQALYFAVGRGADNLYYNDSVGMQVTVSAVPEPGEWAMMLAGLSFVGLMARRRKQG